MHPVSKDLTSYAEFNGWLQANETQEVRARVRGHIKSVNFNNGQEVKKGELLFELDPRPFESSLAAARAQVKIAEAQVEPGDQGSQTARTSGSHGGGHEARNRSLAGPAARRSRREGQGRDRGPGTGCSNIEFSRITADIDGRIGKAELTVGNLVNAGGSDPLLTTINSITPMRVYFNIDERSLQFYARNVKAAGKTVSETVENLRKKPIDFNFELDGETGFTHTANLVFIDNKIDQNTGTILVYGTAENADGFFQPGSRVRVRLPTGQPYQALLVPETAILADQDKRYILIADEKNTVRRRNVMLGVLTDEGMRAIQPADTLAKGEEPKNWWVMVDNLQRARVNYPIDPQKPPQEAAQTVVPGTARERDMISHFFIDRPIFATVLSVVIVIVGLRGAARVAHRAVSRRSRRRPSR